MSFLDKLYGGTTEVQPESTSIMRRAIADPAISLLKGAISLPESAVGLADIVSGGQAGKLAESVGYRPKEAKAILDDLYSPEQQKLNAEVAETKGFIPTIGAAVQRPSTIAHTVLESAPGMIGAGGIARGVLKAAPKLAPMIAGAVGEGAFGAGSAAESMRQESADGLLTSKQAGIATLSGVGTAGFGLAGGSLSKRLGIADVDTMIASGRLTGQNKLNVFKGIGGGMLSEGVFEELPQSAQEQVMQNIGTGKPWDQGVAEAAALGGLAGAAMGGGGQVLSQTADYLQSRNAPVPTGGDQNSTTGPLPAGTQPGAAVPPSTAAPGAPTLSDGAVDTIPEFTAPPAPPAGALSRALEAGGITPGAQPAPAFNPALLGGVANAPTNLLPALQGTGSGAVDRAGVAVPSLPGQVERVGSDNQQPGRVEQGQGSGVKGQGAVIDAEFEDVTQPDTLQIAHKPGPEVLRQGQGSRVKGPVNPQVVALQNEKQKLLKAPTSRGIAGEVYSPATMARIKDINAELQRLESAPIQQVKQLPAPVATKKEVDTAAHAAATSTKNDVPLPSLAQIQAGNYKKGHVSLHGLDIAIENPAGSERKGVDETGRAWSTKLAHHYGYIKGTVGKDKDHVDVFIGPKPDSTKVFVVDQKSLKTGGLDEHKVMMGFDSLESARAGYLASYDKSGPKRIMNITETTADEFKQWLKDGDQKKAFASRGLQSKSVESQKDQNIDDKPESEAISSPSPDADPALEAKSESRPDRGNRLKVAHEKFKAKQAEKDLLKMSAKRFGNAFAIVKAKREALDTKRAQHAAKVATATAAVHTALVNNSNIGKIAVMLKGKNDLAGFTTQVEPIIGKHIQSLVDAAETPQEMLVYSGLLVDGKPVLPKAFYESLRKESGKVYEQANKAAATKKGKEKSTGDSLKRWFDKQRKDLDAIVDAANMEKSWKHLQKLTVRAEHFPIQLADDATPGARTWLEKFRSNLAPWSEYFTQVAIKSSPGGGRRTSLTPQSVFNGSWTSYEGRFADLAKEKLEKAKPVEYGVKKSNGYDASAVRYATAAEAQADIDKGAWEAGSTVYPIYATEDRKLTHAERLEAAKDIAREYQDALKALAAKFEGAKDLNDIERIATDLFGKLSSNSRWERERQLTDSDEYKSNVVLYKEGKFELSRLMPTDGDKYSTWESLKRTENEEKNTTKRDSLIRPRLDKIVRTGLEDKRNGKDISAEQLKKTFGFADITIGQYVTAEQAQKHINYSYDAMMTLADLLHAKPVDLSFGGRLHYAIGALGSGKYAAHFQNEQPHPKGGTVPVINVTNTKGDGAFLHEFFHAIDFMTTDARTRQVISSVKTLLKEKPRGAERVLDKVKSFIVGGSYYPHLGKRSTPKEHALYWLRNGYAHSYSIQKTDYFKAAEKLDAGRGSDLYWSNQYEPFARMAEAWGFDALKGEGKRDDYLVADWCEDGKTTEPQYKGTPYPVGEERGQLIKLFNEFISAMEWTATGPQLKKDHPWQQDLPDKTAGQAFEVARKDAIEKIDDIIANLKLQKEEEQAERERKKQDALWGVTDTGATETPAEIEDAIEAGFPVEEVSGMSLDDLEAIFEQVADSLDASQQEDLKAEAPGEKLQELQAEVEEAVKQTKDTILKAVVEQKAKKQQQELLDNTASDLAKEFAKQGVTGIDEALKGLVALFGAGPNKLQSFPAGFDEDAYKQAKPHFEAAAKAFNAAGLSFKEFVAKFFHTIIQTFGRGVKPYALQFAKDYEETYNQLQQEVEQTEEQKTAEVTQDNAPAMQLALWTKDKLDAGEEIQWQELFKKADEYHGGTQAQGVYSVKDAYDAVEAGVNQYLLDWSIYAPNAEESAKIEHAKFVMKSLVDDVLKYVPTQTKRTAEMDEFQQFSTPPHFSYLANWVANLNDKDVYLEPSAGIGGLATFAKLAGVKEIIVNELSARRLAMIKMLPFDRFFSENAEQLNNILPDDVKPTVIVMNPPFSSTAGRAQGSRDTMNGAKHIEQALARLQPGGRLVAIVGEGMGHDKPAFRDWWKKIEQNYRVRANIGIDGSTWKYGTTFDNQLLVIDKSGQTELNGVVTGKVKHPSEALALLEGIRNDRPTAATTGQDSNVASQPGGRAAVQSGQGTPDTVADSGAAGSGGMVSDGGSTAVQSGNGAGTSRTGATDGNGKPGSSVSDTVEYGQPGNKPGATSSSARTSSKTKDSAINDNLDSGLVSEVALAEAESSEQGAINNSQFEQYTPKKVRIEGAVAHNTPLVESAALAAVTPPDPTYTPNLPKDVIKKGLLSDAQLEAVVYAGQAHEQFLANGKRRGFFLGDGTGVGKGRQISGVILDNLRQGRKKAVWISKKKELIEDAKRDFADIGGDAKLIVGQAKFKADEQIKLDQGILFSGYPTLRGQSKAARDAIKKDGKGAGKDDNKISYVRTQQIANWLGKDFDGVIVFDEAHEMGNAVAVKGKRGMTKPSDQALAALELQRALPKAKILYVSATGATEVSNLAYAERLGLWGEGTPFQDVHAFVGNMNKSVSAMELVAQNLKQMGLYLARSLSFDGIVYNKVDHTLTDYQRETYDLLAGAWQNVLQNINKALEDTGVLNEGKAAGKESGKIKSAIMSAFWGSHQRFFNQIITAGAMPSVLDQVEQDLAEGKSVVLQLVNTNEADQERALAKMAGKEVKEGEEDSVEELDLTPREQLIQFIEKAFPVQQMESYADGFNEAGKPIMRLRPVMDSNGKPVINKDALAKRDELVANIRGIRIPDAALQMLFNHFGADQIAEITGRGQRLLYDEKGKMKVEKRGASAVLADSNAFKDGKKRILVFSQAGGTGFSFHADRRYKNQQQRVHYILQPGWSADKAIQGLGRSHRTNQSSTPVYRLVTTDIPAQKRFISSIARRLEQLGALTSGQRDTAGGSLFSAADNLESVYSRRAIQQFFRNAFGNTRRIGYDSLPADLLEQMGLQGIVDKDTNSIPDDAVPETTQFLNRLLSLRLDSQGQVFDLFLAELENQIEAAKSMGTFDDGMQTIRHVGAQVNQEAEVYRDDKTNAATKYLAIEYQTPNPIYEFDETNKFIESKKKSTAGQAGWFVNNHSGRIAGIYKGTGTRTDSRTGRIEGTYGVWRTSGSSIESESKVGGLGDKWTRIESVEEARKLWEQENEVRPKTSSNKLNMVVGGILPIWDRFNNDAIKVVRIGTDDGRRFLGREIAGKDLAETMRKLNVESPAAKMSGSQLARQLMGGNQVEMSNGWKFKRVKVSNDTRIEIIPRGFASHTTEQRMRDAGVIQERISYQNRYFVPTGEQAGKTLDSLMKSFGMNAIDVGGEVEANFAIGDMLDGYKYRGRESITPIQDVDHREIIPQYIAQVSGILESKGFVVKPVVTSGMMFQIQVFDKAGKHLLTANRTVYKEWIELSDVLGKVVLPNGKRVANGAADALYAAESLFFLDHAYMIKSLLVNEATVHLFNKYYMSDGKTVAFGDYVSLYLPKDRNVVIYNIADRDSMAAGHAAAKSRSQEADDETIDFTDEQLDAIKHYNPVTHKTNSRGAKRSVAAFEGSKSGNDGAVREEVRSNRENYKLDLPTQSGISAQSAQEWVDTLPISKHVNVVQSVDQLPADAREQIRLAKVEPSRVQAMEFNGQIHVITDNVQDLQRIKALVIGHELAHAGQTKKVVDLAVDWFRRTANSSNTDVVEVQRMLADIAGKYGYDLTTTAGYRNAVKETTAALAEQAAGPGWKPAGVVARLFMYIKHWLRQHGLLSSVSNNELSLAVAEMLRIGEKRLSTGPRGGGLSNFALADQGIIAHAKSIMAPAKVADMTRNLMELASQSIPERLKANIGKLLSNPWFGSEGNPVRRMVVNLNLERSQNRNGIISDLFQASEGYTGVEGLDAILKDASKAELKLFNDLIKYGDQNGVAKTFTRDELYRGKTKFGVVPDRVVKAYKAFHEIMNAANRVRFEQLDQLALLPYADQPWYADMVDLLNKNQERMATLPEGDASGFYRLIRSLKRDLTDQQLTSGENPAKFKASKEVIAAYRDFWRQVERTERKHQGNMLSAFRDILGHRGEIAKLKNEWGNLKGYAPRNRKDGDWHVSVYTTNADGERTKVYMKPTMTEAGARRHVSEVLADLPTFLKGNYTEGGEYQVEYERNQATPSELLAWKGSEIAVEALLNKAFDRAGINGKMSVEQWQSLKTEVFQQIAKDIMAQGFGRHGISREEQQIEGYDDTDYQSVLKEYIGGMAGWLSKMRFAVETTREAKKIGQADPMDKVWVNDYVQDAMKNSTYMDELAATARSVGAVYYLGFKVSSAVLNAFQNYTVGQAELTRIMKKAGINRSAVGLLAKAQKDVLKDFVERKQGKAGTLTEEEHDVLVRAVREGTAQAQNVRMMSGSQEMGFGSKWKKFTETAMTPFQFVEQRLNREPGVLAAYRAFKKTEAGVFDEAAYAQAEEFINNTHYVMGRENLPEMVRKLGPLGKTAYLFQGYVHNYLLWMYNRAKNGEFEALARSFGALAAMGGVFALPGADELDKWIEKWFGVSYKLKFKKFMNEQTRGSMPGEALNRFINYGLPSIAGVDFSRAVAVNVPFISDPDRSFGERVGGVWPGLLKKPGMAINAAQKGDYLRAVESLLPEFAANPMRAYRQYNRGATTVSGKPILDENGQQVKYGAADVAKKMMGFQPLEIAEKTQLKTHERAIKSFYTESRDDLLAKLRTAKTVDQRRDAMREIMAFNVDLRKSQAWGLVSVISADSIRGALSYKPGKNDRKRQQWEREQLQ